MADARGRFVVLEGIDGSGTTTHVARLAYQSVSSGSGGSDVVDWIRVLNRFCKRPDLTIVLDVSSDEAARRRASRGEAAQLYEQNEVQRALAAFYRDLAHHLPNDCIVL